ncbi:MAG: hypothetical protein HY784_05470 [Chloroflexi bacterium]|nr:hypothetical protein [Chloroflexota bacterium]
MNDELPRWLGRLAVAGFWGVVLGIVGLALAVWAGVADPRPLGPHLREDHFADLGAWTLLPDPGVTVAAGPDGLRMAFSAGGGLALALTEAPALPYTLEVAGAQTAGEPGLEYGLVFDYRGAQETALVWLNNNGYARAAGLSSGAPAEWFPWQQWPHILSGAAANRLRVDRAAGGAVTARINDELLARFRTRPDRFSETCQVCQLGVAARSQSPGEVVFYWVKLWSGD